VITVVGGVYGERCSLPAWDFVYGSAGRAAACISTRTPTQLYTLLSNELRPDFEQILHAYDIHLRPTADEYTVNFDYLHPLSSPYVLKSHSRLCEKTTFFCLAWSITLLSFTARR
jgi:hypothetical protein